MSKKILIIEDDAFLGDVLVKKLTNQGYTTVLARDGAEGFKKICALKPDLVLLDIILPSMNGYEILEQKAKNPEIKSIPVIVISNSGQPVEINRVLSLGVCDYLVKAQFDPNEVISKVRVQIGDQDEEVKSTGLDGKKIMWVEDDKFLSDIIARKLSHENCTLTHYITGEEALEHIEEIVPDIVMLDVLLPGMNGFQILQKIKSNPKLKHIPVVLISNMGQKSDIEKAETLGATKFLIKATITLDEIVKEIKNILAVQAKTPSR